MTSVPSTPSSSRTAKGSSFERLLHSLFCCFYDEHDRNSPQPAAINRGDLQQQVQQPAVNKNASDSHELTSTTDELWSIDGRDNDNDKRDNNDRGEESHRKQPSVLDKPVPPLPLEGKDKDNHTVVQSVAVHNIIDGNVAEHPPKSSTFQEGGEKDHEEQITEQSASPSYLAPTNISDVGWLLRPVSKELAGRKCLVLDLDETLVHSSFKYIHQADFVIPVEIDSQYHNVYVIKRPGVDEFMKRVGELFEIVVFTASVSKYGDPLLDQLDIHHVVHHRLFRESCYNHNGNYIKNLSQLGRPLKDVIIIDNSPASYILHPQHAVPISSWFSDLHDNELLDMIPFLEDLAGHNVHDVSVILDINV